MLIKRRDAMTKKIVRLFNKAHPIGSRVWFLKWRAQITATVIAHSDYERVKVRNIYTNKEYWVDNYWILNYGGSYGSGKKGA
jgi:hypothetical protein